MTAKGNSTVPDIGLKLRIESTDGQAVAEVGTGPGERFVLAERLPAGRYILYLSGDGGDPGRSYPYSIKWRGLNTDGPIALWSPRGSLRDLTLAASEIGEQAVQTGGRLLARDIGRVYEAIYERENTEKVRKFGPMYLLNRVHVAESVEKAQAVFDAWAVSDHLPEANDRRAYESLGDQPMPPLRRHRVRHRRLHQVRRGEPAPELPRRRALRHRGVRALLVGPGLQQQLRRGDVPGEQAAAAPGPRRRPGAAERVLPARPVVSRLIVQ